MSPVCCVLKASAVGAYKDGKAQLEQPVVHRIRITLTSTNVKNLEKGLLTPFYLTTFLLFLLSYVPIAFYLTYSTFTTPP